MKFLRLLLLISYTLCYSQKVAILGAVLELFIEHFQQVWPSRLH